MELVTIEKALIASVFDANDPFTEDLKLIREFVLNPKYFTDHFTRLMAMSINRLRELDLPIDFELAREKLAGAGKWCLAFDDALIELMTHKGFSTFSTFKEYYAILRENYRHKGFSL